MIDQPGPDTVLSSTAPGGGDAEVVRLSQRAEIRHLHLVERVPRRRSLHGGYNWT